MDEDNLLLKVLSDHPSKFAFITEHSSHFRFQALLSEVTIDSAGCPSLVRHHYRVDNEYFYPASAIKLCAAVAALYKLQSLQKSLGLGVTCTTPISFYPLREGEQVVAYDPSNTASGKITIAHEMRKLFLVSDNVAFDRLYDFTGQHYINETMWQLGLQSTRLRHRLSKKFSTEENKFCAPVELEFGDVLIAFPPKKNDTMIPNNSVSEGRKVGIAHVDGDGKLVREPMDFTNKNCMSLLDLQNLLVKIFCKDIKLGGGSISLFHSFQMMLMETMSEYPSDSCNPVYDKAEFPDDYCKLFLPGLCRVRPKKALRVFNKVGRAYGFTIENAYVFDKERGEGFFLSAVIYTNSNGILNDDKYEYEHIADRLMADLAEMVARAVWKIPPFLKACSPFDCIPSSLRKESQMPGENSDEVLQLMVEHAKERLVEPSKGQCHSMFVRDGHHNSTNVLKSGESSSFVLALQCSRPEIQMQTDKELGDVLAKTSREFTFVTCTPNISPSNGGIEDEASVGLMISLVPKSSYAIMCCYKYFLNE